jgi:hypothetical protein
MTPTQVLTAARNKYNSIGDSFFSDEEMLGLLYEGALEMANETKCIERTYTTSTVASQQEYDFPPLANGIKRITYEGFRLEPINMTEDDFITGFQAQSASTGTPRYYFTWNEVIHLRPIPSAVGTLKIYTFNEPDMYTISSTIEIPTQFHRRLVNFVVSEMAYKDSNTTAGDRYEAKWQKDIKDVKRWMAKKKRTDGFAVVQLEEMSGGVFRG